MKQLVLDYTPFCTRAALVEDGEMIDFSVERASVRGIVGNIYKGKVENVLGGMQAAFVNIGQERNGFLYMGDTLVDSRCLNSKMPPKRFNVSAGDVIMCQVVKDSFGQKGARLTMDITLPGYYVILLPLSVFFGVSRKIENSERRTHLEDFVRSVCPEGMGCIIRSAAKKASDKDITEEIERLILLWHKVQEDYKRTPEKEVVFEDASLFERALRETFSEDVDKVIVNDERIAKILEGKVGEAKCEVYDGERNIMRHFGLDKQINHLCDQKVSFRSGAYIVIDKAEALTVIDVNTGKFVGTSDLEDTVYKTNLAATECIARQLRIRNISGIVIIDFIDMQSQEHRDSVVEALQNALKKDRMKTSTVGMTALGLVELTRKKTRLPLDDFMLQPCDNCVGGFVTSDAQLAFMLRDDLVDYILDSKSDVIYVGAHPNVVDMIFESKILQNRIKNGWKDKHIFFYADDCLSREKWTISDKQPQGKSVYSRILTDECEFECEK